MNYVNDRFKILQAYETCDVIISIIQSINIFLQIHFVRRMAHKKTTQ